MRWLWGMLGYGWLLVAWSGAAPQADVQTVFESGEGGYEMIRTPQVLITDGGAMLVFAQGRNGTHDQSGNDILVRRSVDGGGEWGPLQVVTEKGEDSLNSICVLQVRGSGRILVVGCIVPSGHNLIDYQRASDPVRRHLEAAGRSDWPGVVAGFARSTARVYLVQSDDEGRNWSVRRDITQFAKREKTALACIPGPGLGIELEHGSYAGRILIPCYQLWFDPARNEHRQLPYAIFSDDGGTSWGMGDLARPGGESPVWSANETQLVERDDGSILLNARSSGRAVAVSYDGGGSWTALEIDDGLVGPACAAGLLTYSRNREEERSRLLFSLPYGERRRNGTIWMSYDEGRTWPVSKTLNQDRFGYSCLGKFPNGDIACVFEGRTKGGKAGVLLARFPLGWLEEARDP